MLAFVEARGVLVFCVLDIGVVCGAALGLVFDLQGIRSANCCEWIHAEARWTKAASTYSGAVFVLTC